MAVSPEGLGNFIQRTQKQVKAAPNKTVNQGTKRVLDQYIKRNTDAVRSAPTLGKDVNQPNAPKPVAPNTTDIAAPIAAPEAANNVGNTQEQIQNPDAPTETVDPNAPNALDDMGSSANRGAEALAAKRQREMGASSQAGGVGGELSGEALGGLDAEQSQYARLIIENGRKRGMGDADIQTALMTALAESGLRNVSYGDRDSVGLFQQRTSQGWGSVDQIMDPNYSIGKFYDSLAGIGNRGGMTQWQAAQAVQRSAFADGSNYQAQYQKAMGIYQSYSTGAATAPVMGSNNSASWINSNNGKYHDYDGAYGAQCVDLYNFYVTGFVGGNPNQSRVVGAKDIWNNYDTRAMTRVSANQAPQQGDIVVWGSSWGGGYGHVGIVAGRNADGTIKVLNANATSAGSRGSTVMSNYGMGGVLGFLRPNKLMGK